MEDERGEEGEKKAKEIRLIDSQDVPPVPDDGGTG
jgi:hypothetical protein